MARRLQVYHTDEVVVTFDPNVCIHSGICLGALPAVFDVSRPDWVRPAGADTDAVVAAVARCPSGALQSVRAGQPKGRGADAGAPVAVIVQAHGPNAVRGRVELELPDGQTVARDSCALCRCGETGNPPFCDGSHTRVRFRSPR